MSEKDVETIVRLAFCTEEVAKKTLLETGNIIDAICKIMDIPPVVQPKLTPEQEFFKNIRLNMEAIDRSIKTVEPAAPCHNQESRQELDFLSNENTQKNLIPIQELEEQIQETACPLPSECSSDSQSNGQT